MIKPTFGFLKIVMHIEAAQKMDQHALLSNESPIKPRRIRYKGPNPRRFEEKYKELNPTAHPAELQKVIARGQTPARTHRPICVKEILEILSPKPGELGLDATLGYGGHAEAILPHLLPGGRLFGLDVDAQELPRAESRLRSLGWDEQVFAARRMNFAGILNLMPELEGKKLDFALADLGVSSMQFDNPARGFTYKTEGPLDLRLNQLRGKSAAHFLASCNKETLVSVLQENADELHAELLAQALAGQTIQTTTELAKQVRKALQGIFPAKTHENEVRKVLQRVFQALRIAVNHELEVLDQFLALLPSCMAPGGRIAILTFHSGEDRRVKKSFQAGHQAGFYQSIAVRPIRPTPQEQHSNPRSSSAKLRWAIRSAM